MLGRHFEDRNLKQHTIPRCSVRKGRALVVAPAIPYQNMAVPLFKLWYKFIKVLPKFLPKLHLTIRHSSNPVSPPWHAAPPFLGTGSSQILVRDLVPLPHFALHSVQLDQRLQCPSTGTAKKRHNRIVNKQINTSRRFSKDECYQKGCKCYSKATSPKRNVWQSSDS